MTEYIASMIGGFFTGIGVIAGQYLWNEYIHPRLIKKVEDKIKGEGKNEEKDNDFFDWTNFADNNSNGIVDRTDKNA
jgi:hypothetical protein